MRPTDIDTDLSKGSISNPDSLDRETLLNLSLILTIGSMPDAPGAPDLEFAAAREIRETGMQDEEIVASADCLPFPGTSIMAPLDYKNTWSRAVTHRRERARRGVVSACGWHVGKRPGQSD